MGGASRTGTAMENLRAAAFMVAAMAGFALEDALIKLLSATMPTGQILVILGLLGTLAFAALAAAQGIAPLTRAALHPAVLTRCAAEMVGTMAFVTALALVPLAVASAILQALPLVVTMGAAVLLGEPVGWRRWTAIAVGLTGMLMILRPFGAGFDANALFAVIAVFALALRDLVTRRVPRTIHTLQLAFLGFAAVIPAGALLLALGQTPVAPTWREAALMAGILVLGVTSYVALTLATRAGEVAVVAPFRYSRLVFAMAVGAVVFGERPDGWTLAGAALIIASGLYTFARERRLALARARG
jgi:drug/metabolite transporter (DMT)-like permease